jgi:peptidoglycan/LPS O-acetylase OafA/YrhL
MNGGVGTREYRPDIDGLRAVAIVAVLLFHARPGLVPGGFAGVDIFFVISGYLITKIIAGEVANGTFRLSTFYERRIRRIIPALSLVYLFCWLVCWHLFLPTDFMEFGKSLLASAGFVSNVFFHGKAGYFDSPSHYKPLLHTWSLSVEEQFYIFWPLLLPLLYKVARRSLIPLVVFLLALSSLGISEGQLLWGEKTSAAFFLMPGRAWELLLGAFLALRQPMAPRSWKVALSVLGLFAAIVPLFMLTATSRFPGLAVVPVCAGTALIIWAGREQPIQLLSLRPVVFMGRISYSLYLWHWPLFSIARYVYGNDLDLVKTLALLLLSFVMAILSWRFVEEPFRRRPKGTAIFWRPIGVGLSVIVVAAFAGGIVVVKEGFPRRINAIVAELDRYSQEKNPLQDSCHWIKGRDMVYDDRCKFGNPNPGRKFDMLVIGDSHADAIAPALIQAAQELGLSGYQMTAGGCLPLWGIRQVWNAEIESACDQYRNLVQEAIKQLKVGGTVVIAARWAVYVETTFTENGQRYYLVKNEEDQRSPQRSQEVMKSALKETIEILSSKGFHVVLVGPVPEMSRSQVACYANTVFSHANANVCEVATDSFEKRQSRVREVFATVKNLPAEIFWISDLLCGQETCAVAIDGTYLYRDTDHLNPTGARKFRQQFAEILRNNSSTTR